MFRRVIEMVFIISFGLFVNGQGFASNSVCPDYESYKCTKAIKTDIELGRYGRASSHAEAQCYTNKSKANMNAMNEKGLTQRALGCYYSYLIERFLGNNTKAQASLNNANHLIKFGCLYNLNWLCELSSDILDLEKISLRNEIDADMEILMEAINNDPIFYEQYTHKALPKSINEFFNRYFNQKLTANKVRIINCPGCKPKEKKEDNKVLYTSIEYIGDSLAVSVRLYDPEISNYRVYRTYGYGANVNKEELYAMKADLDKASNGSESLYIPIKQGLENTLSLGIAKIGNYSTSTEVDENRFIFSLKSYDSFNYGNDALGLQISYHITQRQFVSEDPPEPAENEIPPYDQAFGFTLKYMRHFLIQNLYDDKPSFGIGLGLGGFLSGDAYSHKLEIDFKLRLTHYSTWLTYHYITDTKQEFDGDFTKESDTNGFELAFGFEF